MHRTLLFQCVMGLCLALAIGCGKQEDPVPAPSVANFIGIWKADSLPKFSPDDVTSVRYLVITMKGADEIEIQGLFTANFWQYSSTWANEKQKRGFPIVRASQSKGDLQIPNQSFQWYSSSFSLEGKAKLIKDQISFDLKIIRSDTTALHFTADRFCSQTADCDDVFDQDFIGTFDMSGVRWSRVIDMCNNCPDIVGTQDVSYQCTVIERFPFIVEVSTMNMSPGYSLAAFLRNDSLIIPRQYPYDGNSRYIQGNMVVRDGKRVLKISSRYRAETLYDTLISD
jgi:hypothetical protein